MKGKMKHLNECQEHGERSENDERKQERPSLGANSMQHHQNLQHRAWNVVRVSFSRRRTKVRTPFLKIKTSDSPEITEERLQWEVKWCNDHLQMLANGHLAIRPKTAFSARICAIPTNCKASRWMEKGLNRDDVLPTIVFNQSSLLAQTPDSERYLFKPVINSKQQQNIRL